MTDIKIYQGNQIGGSITVISTDSTKIVIDFGESLPGAEEIENIKIDWAEEKVDAVFFTHYHGDHIGRFIEIPEDVTLYMGEVTWKVLVNYYKAINKRDFLDCLKTRKNIVFITENEPVAINDITITPYSVDHSAFDAFMFLVETPEKNILHTGDYRDHGHRGHVKNKDDSDKNVMLEVIRRYVKQYGKRKIDTLITEGTMLGKRSAEKRYSEKDMYREAKELFKKHKYIFLMVSSTNADSLASFYKAAEANKMGFYAKQYLIDQLQVYREAGEAHHTCFYDFKNAWPILPAASTEGLSEKCKHSSISQREHMREDGFVMVVSNGEYYERLIEEFKDLDYMFIYSMWRGYIDETEGGGSAYNKELADFCKKYQAKPMHVGGHAYPDFIAQVIEAVGAEEVITIHTDLRNVTQ